MDDMGRIHGTGTFDHSTRKWKVRTKGITASATIGQLSNRYGVDIPDDERQSRPFWTRYLAELRTQHVLDDARFRRLAFDIMGKEPEQHVPPQLVPIINAASQGNIPELKERVLKTPTLTDSLKHEVTVYIDRQKKKGHKGHYDVRAALDLFLVHGHGRSFSVRFGCE